MRHQRTRKEMPEVRSQEKGKRAAAEKEVGGTERVRCP